MLPQNETIKSLSEEINYVIGILHINYIYNVDVEIYVDR